MAGAFKYTDWTLPKKSTFKSTNLGRGEGGLRISTLCTNRKMLTIVNGPLVEKRLEMQGHMAFAFVDLEKAFDTVPRKMAMATLRWMGAPESEVKMVEAMYENTTGRVVVGSGMSNEFQVNIGLRQGSALSPLLFILVMELISRKISTTDALKKIMYADDLVIVAEHREELQGALEEWNDMFKKHGLKMNLDKTEVMWVGNTERS